MNEPGAIAGGTNRAMLLDGVNDHISVPHATSLALGNGPFTYEAWIKRSNASTAWMNIFQKGASAPQFGLTGNGTVLAKDNVGRAAFAGAVVLVLSRSADDGEAI